MLKPRLEKRRQREPYNRFLYWGSENLELDGHSGESTEADKSNDRHSLPFSHYLSMLFNHCFFYDFSHISECFNHSIKVTSTFTRYKHWFQFPDYQRYKHDTLVIAQFRNPYTWLKAMQKVPHHAPAHMKYRKDEDWRRFLTKEWTMERIGTDRWPNHTEPCQQFFEWKDLISCQRVPVPKEEYKENKYSNYQPFYEMRNDGSGKPYDNIMELRTDKIRNFMSLKDYEGVVDAWTIQYEYLVKKGTKEMIDQIAEVTGVQPRCKPYPAQDRAARSVNADMVGYINRHLNWTVESLIGYAQDKV
jgi:hypothetical protein